MAGHQSARGLCDSNFSYQTSRNNGLRLPRTVVTAVNRFVPDDDRAAVFPNCLDDEGHQSGQVIQCDGLAVASLGRRAGIPTDLSVLLECADRLAVDIQWQSLPHG